MNRLFTTFIALSLFTILAFSLFLPVTLAHRVQNNHFSSGNESTINRPNSDVPELSISKSAPATAEPGEPITYDITVSHFGGSFVTDLLVTDTLPVGAHYVSGGTLEGNQVHWTIPILTVGDSVTVQFVVTATETITNNLYALNHQFAGFILGTTPVVTRIAEPPLAPPPSFDPGPLPAPQLNPDVGPFDEKMGVYLHSGEFYLQEVDLRLPGRGFDYEFKRTYKSQIEYNGPLGHNWQHNYDQHLVGNETDVMVVDGMGRGDTYTSSDGINFTAPAGFYTQLRLNSDGRYTLYEADGMQTTFYALDESATEGALASIKDRNGNMMSFEYNEDGQLTRVIDTLGRPIEYVYNKNGQLQYIEDLIGRRVSFTYDMNGDLIEVTSPVVTGTPNENDFPNGKRWQYTYSSGFLDERLNHNLMTIIAPNEVADDTLTPRVLNTYDTDTNAYQIERVTQQIWGGSNTNGVPAGGTFTISYEEGSNVTTNRTTLIDRNGNQKVYEHNVNGQRVSLKEYSNRELRATDPEFWQTTYAYNADGQLLNVGYPEGNSVEYVYDEQHPNRLQQGNLLAEMRKTDSERGGDQALIITTWTYEPIYNQIRTVTDARGNDASYQPQNGGTWSSERYTTIHTFDYEEACDVSALAAQFDMSVTEIEQRFTDAGICSAPLGDINGDGFTHKANGNLIRTQQPTGKASLALQEIVELWSYNQFGQILSVTDAEGYVDTYEYYPEEEPNGGGYLKQIIVDRHSATPLNIRHLYEYDSVGHVTREVDGRGIATDYVFNQLNQVVQITHAAAHNLFEAEPNEPLELTDIQYIERLSYDPNNNLILRQVEDHGNTSQVGGDNLERGAAFVDVAYAYDMLDQRIEMSEEVSDTLDLVTYYRYDANGNQTLIIEPAGNASASVYDERDLLFQHTRGATSPPSFVLLAEDDLTNYDVRGGIPATTSTHYDGNRNLIEEVDAADTDDSRDNNSDIGGIGDRTRYLYDGFDRLTSEVDSVGKQTVYQYDPAGNIIRESHFGAVGGVSPTNDGPDRLLMPVSESGVLQVSHFVNDTLLAATETHYDELNRAYQSDQALFVNTIPTNRSPDVADGASDIGKDDLTPDDTCAIAGVDEPNGMPLSGYLGCVTTYTGYDRLSRVTFVVEDDGDMSQRVYDGADRVIKTVDAENNVVEMAYDDNHNLIEKREIDVSQVAEVPDEAFLTTFFYDSLNRLQREVNNIGHTLKYRYDSRGNLVARADAQGPMTGASITRRAFADGALTSNEINDFGNVIVYTYDGLNRQIREEQVLTASGGGDSVSIGADIFGIKTSTPIPDLAQGGGDGVITTQQAWDANSLLVSRTDDNGNQTQYRYDNLNRQVSQSQGICVLPVLADECGSPTTISYEYDADNNLIRVTDENGSVSQRHYDALNRLTMNDVTPAPGIIGTTLTTYEYDGLSRATRATDNNQPDDLSDDSTVTTAYDSLGRVIEETQQIGDLPAKVISSAWRADNLRIGLTNANNQLLHYSYDDLDRIQQIRMTETIETINPYTPTLPHYTIYVPLLLSGASVPRTTEVVTTGSFTGSYSFSHSSVPRTTEVVTTASFTGSFTTTEVVTTTLVEYAYIGRERVLERGYANGTRMSVLSEKNSNNNEAGTADVGYDGLRRPVQWRHFDDFNDLNDLNEENEENSLILGVGYQYNRMNQPIYEEKQHDIANRQAYTYDSAYRLIEFNRPDEGAIAPIQRNWQLDGVGNWQQVDDETRQHSSLNQLIERNNGTLIPILSDNNGNITDNGTYLFAWDYQNRLRTVTRKNDGLPIAAYAYDANGRRIRQLISNSESQNGTRDFYYDHEQLIEERNEFDTLHQQYIYGGSNHNELIVMNRNLDDNNSATDATDEQLYYHQNGKKAIIGLTDAQGKLVEAYQYDAYGRQTIFSAGSNGVIDFGGDDLITTGGTSPLGNPYLFASRRLDGETGLYYEETRYMDAVIGRAITRDIELAR